MTPDDTDPGSHKQPLSEMLLALAEDGQRERISVADLLAALGDRALAALLFVFAFPNVLPVPPGTSALLGAPLVFRAAQRALDMKASLKLYIWSFREEGHFHEDVTNRILDDLVGATDPRFMRLTSKFYVRGGIFTNVVAEHRKPGWQPAPRVELTQFAGNSNTRG